MKPLIDRTGKLITPVTPGAAQRDWERTAREIARCEEQLADVSRAKNFPTEEGYVAWKLAAHNALQRYRAERRLLGEWLDSSAGEPCLLRAAYDVLKTWQVVEELELSEEELAVIRRLDDYFQPSERRKASLDKTAQAS